MIVNSETEEFLVKSRKDLTEVQIGPSTKVAVVCVTRVALSCQLQP